MSLDYAGYSEWEISILEKLLNDGGPEGERSARYIVDHQIHIRYSKAFKVRMSFRHGFVEGDWESMTHVGAWWKGKKLVVLKSKSKNFDEEALPSRRKISLVAHEALHISQGLCARTRGGEMEAWQHELKIFENMGGEITKERDKKVKAATTVDEFVLAIKTYDKKYWKGLRIYPPWFPPYDKFP